MVRYYSDINVIKLSLYTASDMIGFSLVPLRLEPSESASLGDSYHVRRARLNLMTLIQIDRSFCISLLILPISSGDLK